MSKKQVLFFVIFLFTSLIILIGVIQSRNEEQIQGSKDKTFVGSPLYLEDQWIDSVVTMTRFW